MKVLHFIALSLAVLHAPALAPPAKPAAEERYAHACRVGLDELMPHLDMDDSLIGSFSAHYIGVSDLVQLCLDLMQISHGLEHEAVQLIRVLRLGQKVGEGHDLMTLLDCQVHGVAAILASADQPYDLHLLCDKYACLRPISGKLMTSYRPVIIGWLGIERERWRWFDR